MIFFLLLSSTLVVQVQAGPHEKNLLNHLFSKDRPLAHNIMERPVKNDSLPLTVEFKVTLQQIIDVVIASCAHAQLIDCAHDEVGNV